MDITFSNSNLPQKGSILLSDPFAGDSYFTRSVVLICSHDTSGSFGFVLNNYIDLSLGELNSALIQFNGRVSIGGPVDKDNLYYIHRFGGKVEGSDHVFGDIYFGGKFEDILQLINENPENEKNVRFFVGYSGWSPNQLDDELTENAWIVVNNHNEEHIMNSSNNLIWKELMQLQGDKFKLLASSPLNPENN